MSLSVLSTCARCAEETDTNLQCACSYDLLLTSVPEGALGVGLA